MLHPNAPVGRDASSTAAAKLAESFQSRFRYADGVYELHLAEREAGGRRARALVDAEAEFALVEEGPLLLLCYRFGEVVPWSAAQFEPPPRRPLTEADSGSGEPRALLCVAVGEGDTLRTVRNLTLSLDFSRALREAAREHEQMSYDPSHRRRTLNGLLRRYPSVRALVTRATTRCLGSA